MGATVLFFSACTREPPLGPVSVPVSVSVSAPVPPSSVATSSTWPTLPTTGALPAYLVRLEASGDLYARVGGGIVPAPAADHAVLRGYPRWVDKGALALPSGERLTILTSKRAYSVGEEVRVVHVHEATMPGVELYVMGPKAIYGEYVDGKLASPAAIAPPGPYDGAVVQSPGVDHNYEVSVHRLPAGTHTIEWRFATLSSGLPPTMLRSNVLTVEVR
jgi:hypothetical protein